MTVLGYFNTAIFCEARVVCKHGGTRFKRSEHCTWKTTQIKKFKCVSSWSMTLKSGNFLLVDLWECEVSLTVPQVETGFYTNVDCEHTRETTHYCHFRLKATGEIEPKYRHVYPMFPSHFNSIINDSCRQIGSTSFRDNCYNISG